MKSKSPLLAKVVRSGKSNSLSDFSLTFLVQFNLRWLTSTLESWVILQFFPMLARSLMALVHLGLGLILVQAIYLNISSISEKQFTIAHRIPACASTVLVPSITLVEWNARFPEPKWFKSEHPDVSRGKVAALDVHNVA